MCTVAILRRPGHEWPLVVGANRDEMIERAAEPPGRHWPDRPEVVAGRDLLAGGSWLGLNDWGVVAAVLNRHGSLGPAAGLRSRGELVLEALDHPDALDAATALSHLEPAAYRSFNLIIADNRDAFWLRHAGTGEIDLLPIKTGLSLIAAGDIDDFSVPRLTFALIPLTAAAAPDDAGGWSAWETLLSDDRPPPGGPPEAALRFQTAHAYGTVSSALIALPGEPSPQRRAVFRHADWLPRPVPWRDVAGG
jgi:hypothetical protein